MIHPNCNKLVIHTYYVLFRYSFVRIVLGNGTNNAKRDTTMTAQQIEKSKDGRLCLQVMDWHGGQWSAIYSLGSCWLSAMERDEKYTPSVEVLYNAIYELVETGDEEAVSISRRIAARFRA